MTYKSGDILTIKLNEDDADHLNGEGTIHSYYNEQIISHTPAPEPVVRWMNYYSLVGLPAAYETKEIADKNAGKSRKALIKVTEYPDGKITAEIVT